MKKLMDLWEAQKTGFIVLSFINLPLLVFSINENVPSFNI